jgi:tetratricopeptide (TPR) repeat protein
MYDQALNDFNRTIELNPRYLWGYINRASTYLKFQQYEKTIEDCDKAIEVDPANPEAYSVRSYADAFLQDYEQTTKDIDKAISLSQFYVEERGDIYGVFNSEGMLNAVGSGARKAPNPV